MEARRLEMEYVNKKPVWQKISRKKAKAMGWKIVKSRWIDINKGDKENVFVRSRMVVQETAGRSNIRKGVESMAATFAATPPLEAVKVLLSLLMSGRKKKAQK